MRPRVGYPASCFSPKRRTSLIALTKHHGPKGADLRLWLNPSAIASLQVVPFSGAKAGVVTEVGLMGANEWHKVVETPEVILAMMENSNA